MSSTQTETELHESTAQKFRDVNLSLDGMLKGMLNQLEGLREQWVGAGGRSFEQVKQAWARDQKELHRALSETAEAIKTAGRQYSTTDSDAASRVGSTHSGSVNLPL